MTGFEMSRGSIHTPNSNYRPVAALFRAPEVSLQSVGNTVSLTDEHFTDSITTGFLVTHTLKT